MRAPCRGGPSPVASKPGTPAVRTAPAPAPPDAPPGRPVAPLVAAALVAATVALRLPAYLAERHLTVDDGVFGASAVAMRNGGVPFRDVFSSQGPLFLPLVRLADLAGFQSPVAPRLLSLAAAVALVAAVLAAGIEVGSRRGAVLAAGLTAVTGSVLWVTGPIAADGPALALATTAVALALALRRLPSTRTAVLIGVALGAGLSVKSLLLPAAVPVGLVLLRGPRRHLLQAVGAAIAVGLVSALPWGLADVWDQSVDYHLDAAGERTPLANTGKVLSTLVDRDLPVVVVAALALGATVLAGRRSRTRDGGRVRDDGRLLLLAWLGATVAVLLVEHPLWRPHVAYLVPPIALLVARRPPPLLAIALAAVVVVPYHVLHVDGVLAPEPYRGDEAAVVGALRALPEGAVAISDEPGLVWRAGRRTPHDLVDASRLRIESGRITAGSLAAAAAEPEVCAVAVWSSRFAGLDGLPDLLADAGYRPVADYGGDRVLYTRRGCPG